MTLDKLEQILADNGYILVGVEVTDTEHTPNQQMVISWHAVRRHAQTERLF